MTRTILNTLFMTITLAGWAACPTPDDNRFGNVSDVPSDVCTYPSGNYSVRNGRTLNIYGDFTIDGDFTIYGTLNIYGTVTITGTTSSGFGGVIYVRDGGTLNAQDGLATGLYGGFYVAEGGTADVTGNVVNAIGAAMIIEGDMGVSGNYTSAYGSNVTVNDQGNLTVGGDFNSGNNSNINATNGGDINVGGDFNNGEGSTVTVGDGSVITVEEDFNNIDNDPEEEDTAVLNIEEGGAVIAQNINNSGGTINNSNVEGCTTASDGTECCGADCPTLLPVVLVYFGHESINNNVTLNWKTASEVDNWGFEIQRQLPHEKGFTTVGFLKGNGTSKVAHEYSYPAGNVSTDTYFRLKQIDYDGMFEYSPIVLVRGTEANEFTVFPNPFTTSLSIEGSGVLECSLFDLSGQLMGQWSKVSNAVLEEEIIKSINNAKGTYFLKVHTPNQTYNLRIIKK